MPSTEFGAGPADLPSSVRFRVDVELKGLAFDRRAEPECELFKINNTQLTEINDYFHEQFEHEICTKFLQLT